MPYFITFRQFLRFFHVDLNCKDLGVAKKELEDSYTTFDIEASLVLFSLLWEFTSMMILQWP
jgi:hypothetical protein